MEKQIKNIITNKLHDINFKNNTDEKELELLQKLCDIFPEFKENNTNNNNTNTNTNTNDTNDTNDTNKTNETNITNGINNNNEIILDEIIINDKTLYKDKYGGIWNDNIELVGTANNINNCTNYVLFDTCYNLDNDINKFI